MANKNNKNIWIVLIAIVLLLQFSGQVDFKDLTQSVGIGEQWLYTLQDSVTQSYGASSATAAVTLKTTDIFDEFGDSNFLLMNIAQMDVECAGDHLYVYHFNDDQSRPDSYFADRCSMNGCTGYSELLSPGQHRITLKNSPGEVNTHYVLCFDAKKHTASNGDWSEAYIYYHVGFWGDRQVVDPDVENIADLIEGHQRLTNEILVLKDDTLALSNKISELNLDVTEFKKLIDELQLTQEKQAELINQQNLEINDLVILIQELQIDISDLKLTTEEQAAVIQKLTKDVHEQSILIEELQLSDIDKQNLINALTADILQNTEAILEIQSDISNKDQILNQTQMEIDNLKLQLSGLSGDFELQLSEVSDDFELQLSNILKTKDDKSGTDLGKFLMVATILLLLVFIIYAFKNRT